MKVSKLFAGVAAFVALCSGSQAMASVIGSSYVYNLTQSDSFGTSTTPYATVTLTQTSNSVVSVGVALNSKYTFASTGSGDSFAFNLLSAYSGAKINYSGTDFTVNPYGSYNNTPYGLFTNSFDLSSTGTSGKFPGPLNFTVSLASGIGLDAFTTSTARNGGQAGGYGFSIDIGNGAGKTGTVGYLGIVGTAGNPTGDGNGSSNNVPEPGSIALLGLGMLGMAALRKRHQG